jgi:hypothetical protein
VQPTDADNQTVTWSSDDPAVATVVDGLVTAVADGTAIITVTTQDGSYTAACTITVRTPDVYVAGMSSGGATLWKNGAAQNLSGEAVSSAHSVFVLGSDVYVAGRSSGGATLWKNGVAQYLTGPICYGCQANSVFVSGSDVYVAGMSNYRATLWKNGVVQNLDEVQNFNYYMTQAHSVAVAGSDVYVAGYVHELQNCYYWGCGDTVPVAVLWKNGVAQKISDAFYANSVFVDGSDVYVALEGYEATLVEGFNYYNRTSIAKLWKNGIVQNLPGGTAATSVYVSNNDVYVTGYDEDKHYSRAVAKLWKNGVAQDDLTDGSKWGEASSVYVFGSDVYVVGYEGTSVWLGTLSGTVKLWKNGVAQDLGIGRNSFYYGFSPYSVFVK